MRILRRLFRFADEARLVNAPRASADQESTDQRLAFFLFDSDTISDEETGEICPSYAQGSLLRAMGAVLQPTGGWKELKLPLTACHGDLIDIPMMGHQPATDVVADWIKKNEHSMDSSLLSDEIQTMLRKGGRLSFMVYAIGLGPIATDAFLKTDKLMKQRGITGYHGALSRDDPESLPVVAHALHLPVQMRISSTKCTGWLASSEALAEAGLRTSA